MPGVFSGESFTLQGERPSTLEWWRPQVSFSNPNKIYDQQDTCSSWSGSDILHNHLCFEKTCGKVRIAGCLSWKKIQVQIDKSMSFYPATKKLWL